VFENETSERGCGTLIKPITAADLEKIRSRLKAKKTIKRKIF
jgi:hypothetical protein